MIITLEGRMGTGKTTVATMFAYDKYLKGGQVFSNYDLKFPLKEGCKKPKKFNPNSFLRMNSKNFDLTNCLIISDEGYLYTDKQRTMSSLTGIWNYFIVQTRKRNVDVIVTTHSFERLSQRTQQAVDLRIACKYFEGVPLVLIDKRTGAPLIRNEKPIQAKDDDGNPLWADGKKPVIKLTVQLISTKMIRSQMVDPTPIHKLFNTAEVVSIPTKLIKI